MSDERVAVTVLTGFLGAGKTTLLNRWLRGYGPGEAAVLVNEVGEVGIDGVLLHGDGRTIDEISGGCICCLVQESLVTTLAQLALRQPRPRRLFVETSGLAEPGPVVEAVGYGNLPRRLRLDAIVTVVDPVSLRARLGESPVVAQITAADRVVLSRSDLASDEQIAAAEATVRRLNPLAQIIRARRGQLDDGVDPEAWLAERLGSLTASSPSPAAPLAASGGEPSPPTPLQLRGEGSANSPGVTGPGGAPGLPLSAELERGSGGEDGTGSPQPGDTPGPHVHDLHTHAADVTAVALVHPGPLDPDALRAWLDEVSGALGERLFRLKGIVALPGQPGRTIVQGVGTTVALEAGRGWGDEPPSSRVVVIGRGLDREALESGFARCGRDVRG